MACLSESQVLGFVELRLSSEEQSGIEAHIDACAACRQLLADIAMCSPTPRGDAPEQPDRMPLEGDPKAPSGGSPLGPEAMTPSGQPPDKPSRALLFGTALADRYVVLEILGMGGMGVVYAAYDRQLDRKVALKLVLPERGSEERLLREAKSLARLSHPNVVVVHDVGEALGRTYMAMELIEGQTVRRWIEEARPPVDRIIATYLEAAKGLAAAHASGLIHRDFKPDNVLIAKDGRVRVTDFGLARPLRPGAEPDGPKADALLPEPVAQEQAGSTLEGTPFYIAPERYLGRPSDERSDQFAFCVSLYESLYGEVPFQARGLRDLVSAMREGRVRPPRRGSKVPAAVRSALLRGLAADPAARFPSMEALSAGLRSSERRRRALRFAAVGLFAAVGAASAVTALHAREATPLCQGADRRLAGLWDAPRRQSLEQAFLKTGVPYAQASFRTVREALDRYASSWSSAHTDACVATRVYGEQSEEVLDRRVACLEGQLLKLRAVVETMAGADKAAVEKAAETASRLADPALCGAADVLNALVLPPEGKEAQARVAAARERLAELEALRSLGHRTEALEGGRALFQEAEAIGYRPLVAEVGLAFGSVLRGKASSGEARKTLEKALYAAEAGHHERVALGLWLQMATHAIWNEGHYEEAERALAHAEAYLERLEGDSERIMLLERRSSLYRAQGRIAEGTQAARDAVALAEKVFGAGSIRVAGVLMELGIMLHLSDENDASIQAFSRGIAIAEAQLGKDHPNVGTLLANLGSVHMDRKRYPEAVEALRRAVDILDRSLGPGGSLSPALSGLGDALLGMGRPAEALDIARRGLAIDEAVLGPKHPNRARSLARVAEARVGVGRWEEAGPEFMQAYELAVASEDSTVGAEVLGRAKKSLGPCGAPCAAMLRRLEERAKERGR